MAKKKNQVVMTLVVLLVIVAIGGGYYLFTRDSIEPDVPNLVVSSPEGPLAPPPPSTGPPPPSGPEATTNIPRDTVFYKYDNIYIQDFAQT